MRHAQLSALLILFLSPAAQADLTVGQINVTFDDPGNAHAAYYADITNHTIAAAQAWGRFVAGINPAAIIDVIIGFPAIPTGNGRSATSAFVETANVGGTFINVFQQGMSAELLTGVDPNGGTADVEINLGPSYLTNELWFDPDPFTRAGVVPIDRTDAQSVFLHEFGHALYMNGWKDATNGSLPGNFMSTFDQDVVFDGTNLFFTGANAVAAYGGNVPVTFGNNFHLGNNAPRPGADLIPDLMNGVVFFRGDKYEISTLDLAIMADTGIPLAAGIPEPSGLALIGMALAGLVAVRRRKQECRACELQA